MNWYDWFFESASKNVNEYFSATRLFIALTGALSESEFATKEDLQDLVRAYKDYEKGVRYNERISAAVSAS